MTADARPGEGTDESGVAAEGAHRLPRGGLFRRGGHDLSLGEDPTTELPPAYEQLGQYRLVEKLGEGGMGVVHKGIDAHGQEVAIKVLRSHIAHDSDARDRLRREMQSLSRVRHDSVAPVLDADVDGDRPYLVTRYVPGPPLDDVVDELGPLGPQQLVTLGRGLAEALRSIHAAGVVHRDLKPGNVLMVGDDPVLIDFGIAHVADDVRLTMTGLVMGTPGYLSPEVVEGEPVTESTDWWGWAATLAFAASGQAPFGRGPMTLVLDRVTRGEADLSGVDERLRPLLARALSPHPADRPSASVVLAEMQEYAAGGHTTGIPIVTDSSRMSAPESQNPSRPATEPIATAAPRAASPTSTQQTPVVSSTQVQPVRQPDATSVIPQAAPATPAAFAPSSSATATPAAPPAPARPFPQQRVPASPQAAQAPYAQPQNRPTAYPAPAGSQASRWQAGSGPGPVAPGQWGQREHDPRIGQPPRTWTLVALLAAGVAITALWPVIGGFLILAWTVGARWLDRAMTAMVLRRYEAGRRKTDGVVAVVASPWHALRAALSSLFSLLIPLFVGGFAATTTALTLSMMNDNDPALDRSLPIAVGTLIAVWVMWWGPGGTSMRRGSRSIVRSVVKTEPLTRVVIGLAIAIALVGAIFAFGNGGEVSWAPWTGPAWPVNDWLPDLPSAG